jgi:hypothetical protein
MNAPQQQIRLLHGWESCVPERAPLATAADCDQARALMDLFEPCVRLCPGSADDHSALLTRLAVCSAQFFATNRQN